MKIKIVGFKVGVDRSTCYYKINSDNISKELTPDKITKVWEKQLGHYMRLALDKSDFVSVRK